MTLPSVTRAAALCDHAVLSLQLEKQALLEAVLALKVNERKYWENALASEQARVDKASAPCESECKSSPEQKVDAHEDRIAEYRERIDSARASEDELHAMLEECRRWLARSAARDPPSLSLSQPPARDAHDLTRMIQALHITGDDA